MPVLVLGGGVEIADRSVSHVAVTDKLREWELGVRKAGCPEVANANPGSLARRKASSWSRRSGVLCVCVHIRTRCSYEKWGWRGASAGEHAEFLDTV